MTQNCCNLFKISRWEFSLWCFIWQTISEVDASGSTQTKHNSPPSGTLPLHNFNDWIWNLLTQFSPSLEVEDMINADIVVVSFLFVVAVVFQRGSMLSIQYTRERTVNLSQHLITIFFSLMEWGYIEVSDANNNNSTVLLNIRNTVITIL